MNRYLLRIETSNPSLYANFHPDSNFKEREKCLKTLALEGYQVGTGVLIGLPGQTPYDLARDVCYYSKIGAHMLGMGPYVPAEGTPLAAHYSRTQVEKDLHTESLFETAMRMVAVTRLAKPRANISATTAMEVLDPNGRVRALRAGANVVMPVLTPVEEKVKYQLYKGKTEVKSGLDVLRS